MGSAFSSFYTWLFNVKEVRIMMVGLGNSGKTTALYKLKLGEVVTTIPTIANNVINTTGFNVETVHYKNFSFTVWDVGWGGGKIRYLWGHYCQDTKAVIFVVDSTDREWMKEAKDCLHSLLDIRELGDDFVLLVLANKQDLSNAMRAEELSRQLDLRVLRQRWHIQETCATNGKGLHEGLAWLSNELNKLL